ncbi:MAG TPA: M20/M25/M40 family metallo-hydrolase [Parvularculaceae bacterium]|nr:M20/M25/M40 family metallo-hydrolase [Parvularculaceae bacterium]
MKKHIFAFALLFWPQIAAAAISPEEQKIRDAVAARKTEAVDFLETVVNIASGTMSHDGVRAVGAEFSAAFEELGFETRWESFPDEVNRAGHLIAKRDGGRGRKILLIGHLDTVYESEDGAAAFRREGDTAYGPGVEDMKGGDVVVLYALKALADAGALDGAAIEIVFTGDEEFTGKPIDVTRKSLIEAAMRADVALNFEAGEEGVAVTSRRGASGWRLTTSGKRNHSSGIFRDDVGAGAIFEAARIMNDFYEKLHKQKYLTFNVGAMVGGSDVQYEFDANKGSAFGKTNVVAQKAVVDGDLRFISEEQKEKARAVMRKIVERHLPLTDAEIEFIDSYPAMSPSAGNDRLLSLYSAAAEDLGYGPFVGNDPAERGAADISFAAPYVDAALDGLGPIGEGGHTPNESLRLSSIREATERAAILIWRLTREDAPEL